MSEEVSTIHSSVTERHLKNAERYHKNERQFSENTSLRKSDRRSSEMDGHMWTEYGYDNLDSWDNKFAFFLEKEKGFKPRHQVAEVNPFAPGAKPTTIEGEYLVNQFIGEKEKPKILELAGPGGFIRRIEGGQGLAVSLGDGRSNEVKQSDKDSEIDFIEADLLTDEGHGDNTEISGWNAIQEWSEKNTDGGFDLIVSNPIGGWGELPQNLDLYAELLIRTTRQLKKQGAFLLSIPDNWDPKIVEKISERNLRKLKQSFNFYHGKNALVIERIS